MLTRKLLSAAPLFTACLIWQFLHRMSSLTQPERVLFFRTGDLLLVRRICKLILVIIFRKQVGDGGDGGGILIQGKRIVKCSGSPPPALCSECCGETLSEDLLLTSELSL